MRSTLLVLRNKISTARSSRHLSIACSGVTRALVRGTKMPSYLRELVGTLVAKVAALAAANAALKVENQALPH